MKTKEIIADLRSKTVEELVAYIREMKQALFDLQAEFLLKSKTVKPHLFPLYKKNIARAKTIIKEKGSNLDA